MTPAQTAGKKLAYLYSENQPAWGRSWLVSQDTPAQKSTYEATIITPADYVARMSGNLVSETPSGDKKTKTTQIKLDIPIATYLIAIVVGDLQYQKLGDRTGVYTEPVMMPKVAAELADLETILTTAETYLTPYAWGEYNVVILPPSYPMGGMENPLLTFASPTIIVGDKSQVAVATHEIMHSWSGNLVTCQNWEDLWLNEGFTVFEERKVSSKLYGLNFALTSAMLGAQDL
jgi:aminopeptidase N